MARRAAREKRMDYNLDQIVNAEFSFEEEIISALAVTVQVSETTTTAKWIILGDIS
jgi:hypothetical protein